MIPHAEVNLPHVKAEVEAAFLDYEAALKRNDLQALDRYFWHSPHVVRYGAAENLYGIMAIRAFRAARDAAQVPRLLTQTCITTFGEDAAVATTEFRRPGQPPGRQSQTWIRFPEGWRIVSAHISLLETP
jgi:hypothetical protein